MSLVDSVIKGVESGLQTALRSDSWVNAVTGVGTAMDKLKHTLVKNRGRVFSDDQLEQLYCSDDLAARIVDVIPDEMLRQGYKLNIGNDEGDTIRSAMSKRISELGIDAALVEAMKWARLYGAGAIIVGAGDGQDPALPLDETKIEKFTFVNVVDRRDMTINKWYSNPFAPKFNKAERYTITHSGPTSSGQTIIHESRLILFEAPAIPWRRKLQNVGFSWSVLERVADVLQEFHTTWKSSAHLMTDMAQGVVSIDGLMNMIAGGQKDLLMDRIEIMDMSRSVARLMLLDADKETFTRTATPITGVADLLELAMLRVASAAGPVPVSILFGQDPSGMNSTGDMQIRRFYDMIKSGQEKDLLQPHTRLLRLLFLSKDGPTGGKEPDSWSIEYNSLWQMTDAEKADLRLATVQADTIEIDNGTLLVDELALGRHTKDGFNAGAIQIDRGLRMFTLERDKMDIRMGKDTTEPNP